MVDPRKVWSFVLIAMMTSEGKIARFITPSVLLGNDVLDVEAEEKVVVLVHAAILTPISGTLPHQTAGCFIHQGV